MFAPKDAETRPKAAEAPTIRSACHQSELIGLRFSRSPVEQALLLQRTIGNRETLRLLARQVSRPAGPTAAATISRRMRRTTSPIRYRHPGVRFRLRYPSSAPHMLNATRRH